MRCIMDFFIDRVLSDHSSGSTVDIKIEYIIAQVSTSFVSLVSSTTMAVMIVKKGITTPYRRIIFGLSVSDIMQSLGFFLGPLAIPRGVEDSWGMGDQGTCQADGFFLVLGMTAVPMYTCFLCFYYLCRLKFRMENAVFARRMEWKIHAFIILYNIAMIITALSMNTIHPALSKTVCTIAVTPLGCRIYPDIVGECDPVISSHVTHFAILNNFSLPSLCLVGMVGIMGMLYCHAVVLNRMSPSSEPGPRQVTGHRGVQDVGNSMESNLGTDLGVEETSEQGMAPSPSHANGIIDMNILEESGDINHELASLHQPATEELDQIQTQQNHARYLSTLYKKETFFQGCLYVGSFIVVYSPMFITFGHLLVKAAPPKHLQFSLFTFVPLGGLLNILVYTRPQTASLRRHFPTLSRSRCLWLVLRAGGELPVIPRQSFHPVNAFPLSPVQQESNSQVQIGVASSSPPSELIVSGFRSNLSMNGRSLSFGSSTLTDPNIRTSTQNLESIQEHDIGSSSSQDEDESVGISPTRNRTDESLINL